jgi:hypothetical protein
VIEASNPADSEHFLPKLNHHIGFYGEAPRQTDADGGFASRHNLGEAKALGVRDVAFHKKAGLRVMDMARSNWVYRKLRAGIESDILCLKRGYGLARCIWRGLDHFRACVWSSVVAYNLALFARLKPADRSIPSPIKLSLDRPELGSNPHGSPRRQRRLIAVCEPTPKTPCTLHVFAAGLIGRLAGRASLPGASFGPLCH